MTLQQYTRGSDVVTPGGVGVVVYTRNGPPDYREPVSVSVELYRKRGLPGYRGSVYSIADCEAVAELERRETLERYPARYCADCHAFVGYSAATDRLCARCEAFRSSD